MGAEFYATSIDIAWKVEQEKMLQRAAQKRHVQERVRNHYAQVRPASDKFDTRVLPPVSVPTSDLLEQERERDDSKAAYRRQQDVGGQNLVALAAETERELAARKSKSRQTHVQCSDYNRQAMLDRQAKELKDAQERRTAPAVDPNRFFGTSLS